MLKIKRARWRREARSGRHADRMLVLVLGAVMLGLLTTLAVAVWAVGAGGGRSMVVVGGVSVSLPSGEHWYSRTWRGPVRSVMNVSAGLAAPVGAAGGQAPPAEILGSLPHGPWRIAVRDDPIPAGSTGCFWNHQAVGWPMRALAGGFYNVGAGGVRTTWLETGLPVVERIPIAPIWRGLVVDTAVFGGLWLVLLFAGAQIWQRLPRRSGSCRSCGYSLAGLGADTVCPECGAAREV